MVKKNVLPLPTDFKTFAPTALAGKGKIIPQSVKQRGVIIRLQRRSGSQYIEDFLNKAVAVEAEEIREGLVQWSEQSEGYIAILKPEVPVTDRAREVWLPLFLVAELAGQRWRQKALESLSHHQSVTSCDPVSRERQLLIDICTVWSGDLDFSNVRVRNHNTFVYCKNAKKSRYYGIAFAHALVNGKQMQTLKVRSANILPFKLRHLR